jgi:hypothetical protein
MFMAILGEFSQDTIDVHIFNAYFNALNIHHDVCIAVPDDLQVQFKAIIPGTQDPTAGFQGSLPGPFQL